jgi:hypothetical protein
MWRHPTTLPMLHVVRACRWRCSSSLFYRNKNRPCENVATQIGVTGHQSNSAFFLLRNGDQVGEFFRTQLTEMADRNWEGLNSNPKWTGELPGGSSFGKGKCRLTHLAHCRTPLHGAKRLNSRLGLSYSNLSSYHLV